MESKVEMLETMVRTAMSEAPIIIFKSAEGSDIQPLRIILEQRKILAKAILTNSDYKEGIEAFKCLNIQIAQALGINKHTFEDE